MFSIYGASIPRIALETLMPELLGENTPCARGSE